MYQKSLQTQACTYLAVMLDKSRMLLSKQEELSSLVLTASMNEANIQLSPSTANTMRSQSAILGTFYPNGND